MRKPFSIFTPGSVKLHEVRRKFRVSFCVKSTMSISKEQELVREETTSSALGEKDAVIIVDHGSRRQESNLMLSKMITSPLFGSSARVGSLINFVFYWTADEFVAMFKSRTGYQTVEPAHMVIIHVFSFVIL